MTIPHLAVGGDAEGGLDIDLGEMSRGMGLGLSNRSSDLSSMLNAVSSALTSKLPLSEQIMSFGVADGLNIGKQIFGFVGHVGFGGGGSSSGGGGGGFN